MSKTTRSLTWDVALVPDKAMVPDEYVFATSTQTHSLTATAIDMPALLFTQNEICDLLASLLEPGLVPWDEIAENTQGLMKLNMVTRARGEHTQRDAPYALADIRCNFSIRRKSKKRRKSKNGIAIQVNGERPQRDAPYARR